MEGMAGGSSCASIGLGPDYLVPKRGPNKIIKNIPKRKVDPVFLKKRGAFEPFVRESIFPPSPNHPKYALDRPFGDMIGDILPSTNEGKNVVVLGGSDRYSLIMV